MLASGTPHSSLTHRIVALGAQLTRAGHQVTIAAPHIDKHSHWEIDQPKSIDGVRFVYPFQFQSRSLVLNLLPYILDVCRVVLVQRPQLVYIYKPTPLTLPGLLAKVFWRTPVVTDLDDLGSEVMRIEHQPAPLWRLTAWCERTAIRFADGVVVASQLLKREVSSSYPHKPIVLLPNGVDPAQFQPINAHARRVPHVVFFGLLGRPTITKPLLEAMAQIRRNPKVHPIQLDIMGDGPYRAELEAYAQELGIAGTTTFWGWASYEQFREHVHAGDIAICVMPQERTTAACSNQKVFQYQALALALIVSRVGDLPAYVEDGKSGMIVEPDNARELADAIAALAADATTRNLFAERSRSLAKTANSWQTRSQTLAAFLEDLTK
jgi:glycosyltransferase involved in cell wall biosynthesis